MPNGQWQKLKHILSFWSEQIYLLAFQILIRVRVVMYGCESWTVKKAEHWRIDAFELWCWRRLLRVPWTARRCNQSILKEISPGCSLEGLMIKLRLQYFGHLMRRVNSLEKALMLGGVGGRRRRGRQRMRSHLSHFMHQYQFILTDIALYCILITSTLCYYFFSSKFS